jgi:orotidine-5'-phosphate decarboxylase
VDEQAAAAAPFADRLATAVVERRSQLVVGLDPRLELLPLELRGDAQEDRAAAAGAFTRFCRGLIDAVAPYVVAVKPQAACFEVLGAEGMRALEEICDYAATVGLLVIVDGKRGDIGHTARAYASAYLEPRDGSRPLADAMTVNPYLGRDSLEPFVTSCRRSGGGIFCLVKTSNAGGSDVQDLTLSDGSQVWQQVARLVADLAEEVVGECGLSCIGAVVGATFPRAVSEARRLLPKSILLLPGVGAQGATPADVARAFTSGPASALVTVSRSVIYAFRFEGDDWRSAAGSEAARLRDEVWAASGW